MSLPVGSLLSVPAVRSSCRCSVLTLDPQVTVGRDDAVEGGLSNFLVEAEGMAAKAWLLVHGGNWKEVLEDKRGSQVFGQEELEDKRGVQEEWQVERQVDSPQKMPTKVTAAESTILE